MYRVEARSRISDFLGSYFGRNLPFAKSARAPQGSTITYGIGNLSARLPAPAYDSGWIPAAQTTVTFDHNLGTTEVLVYLIAKDDNPDWLINQYGYGYYLQWVRLTDNQISVQNYLYSEYIRVMLWKIAEP